ncbi:hypothetical protein [Sanguibacter sp. HDW7]|uniref:hypothetical protein n=1 Tax=Sanguibacter sp. HDW7 TaxID=2714931 RepID=UPI001409C6D8|nr:hypothetical protein [Sanguibacter sp. HDW7]QIK83182.1 hypothetical protein G7063_05735 [Sanguibacter sp. HDW7]
MSRTHLLRRTSTVLVAMSVAAFGAAALADGALSGAASSAFVEDAQSFARTSGEDRDDVVARALVQAAQEPYLESFLEAYASRYASSEMTGDGRLVIQVTGAVEPGMQDLVASRDDIELEGGAMYTADESAALAFEVFTAITEADGSIKVLLGHVEPSNGVLELLVSAGSDPAHVRTVAEAVLREVAGPRAATTVVKVIVGLPGDGITYEHA